MPFQLLVTVNFGRLACRPTIFHFYPNSKISQTIVCFKAHWVGSKRVRCKTRRLSDRTQPLTLVGSIAGSTGSSLQGRSTLPVLLTPRRRMNNMHACARAIIVICIVHAIILAAGYLFHFIQDYRIGEASNPGPNKHDPTRGFVLEVANVTHLANNAHRIARRDFDALLISEHSLMASQMVGLRDKLGKDMFFICPISFLTSAVKLGEWACSLVARLPCAPLFDIPSWPP